MIYWCAILGWLHRATIAFPLKFDVARQSVPHRHLALVSCDDDDGFAETIPEEQSDHLDDSLLHVRFHRN